MSWDADLIANEDGHERTMFSRNYTHNCNRMITKVLTTVGYEMERAWFDGDRPGTCWWLHLDGQNANESLPFLDTIIGGLMEAPALFREMNPDNGWGDYDSLLATLRSMRSSAATYPSTTWRVSG